MSESNLPAIAARGNSAIAIGPSDLLAAVLSGRRAKTLAAYRSDFVAFGRFAGAATPGAALDALVGLDQGAANALVLSWRAEMTDRGLAPATVARRLAAIRSAVRVARMLGRCAFAIEVEPPRVVTLRDTLGPGREGYRKMLAVARSDASTGAPVAVRNLALVKLVHDLGLRRFEATGLDLADVDLDGSKVWILGKGRTAREALTVPPGTLDVLRDWLAVRGDSPGPVFTRLSPGAKAERLSGDAVNEIVKSLGRRAGIAKPVRAHSLRHCALTEALDRTNGDVRTVARFSRHKKLDTLMVYDDRRRDAAGEVARLVADDD